MNKEYFKENNLPNTVPQIAILLGLTRNNLAAFQRFVGCVLQLHLVFFSL